MTRDGSAAGGAPQDLTTTFMYSGHKTTSCHNRPYHAQPNCHALMKWMAPSASQNLLYMSGCHNNAPVISELPTPPPKRPPSTKPPYA